VSKNRKPKKHIQSDSTQRYREKSEVKKTHSVKESLYRAQELMYEVWKTEDQNLALELAREALKISSDCADAYVFLADNSDESFEATVELYENGIEAGKRALGGDLESCRGKFWLELETRPYMRALLRLGYFHFELEEYEEAAELFQYLLEIDPNDHLGARIPLASCLFMLKEYAELKILLATYAGDADAEMEYARALLMFAREGDTQKSRKQLRKAFRANIHVPLFLIDSESVPDELGVHYIIGDESEAGHYCEIYRRCWATIPGSLEWLGEISVIELYDDDSLEESDESPRVHLENLLEEYGVIYFAKEVETIFLDSHRIGSIPSLEDFLYQIFAPEEPPEWKNEKEMKRFTSAFRYLWFKACHTKKMTNQEALDLLLSPMVELTDELLEESRDIVRAILSRHNRILLFLRYLDGKYLDPSNLPPQAMAQLSYLDGIVENLAHLWMEQGLFLKESDKTSLIEQMAELDSIAFMLMKAVLSGEDVPEAPFVSGKIYRDLSDNEEGFFFSNN